MKKNITIIATILLFFGLQACSKINNQGPVIREERTVATFSKIEAEFAGDVILVQGANQKVKAQAQEKIMPDLVTEVSNGVLKIRIKNNVRITTGKDLKVYVTIPNIDQLWLSGSGDIDVDNSINSQNLDLKLTGSGDINISNLESNIVDAELTGSGNIKINGGSTASLKVKLTGSGDFKGQNFNSQNANVTVTGSGNATVRVSNTLNANITGSGNINYYGNPSLTQNVTGSGSINRKG